MDGWFEDCFIVRIVLIVVGEMKEQEDMLSNYNSFINFSNLLTNI